jgi:ferritin-like metal-binding protein YciE
MKKTRIALVTVGLLALAGGSTALASKGNGHTKKTLATTRGEQHGPGDELEAAASYLGTTAASLETQLQAGKTLAQLATSTNGKSIAGLIAALAAAEKTEIAAAVTSGKLTQAQADQVTPMLTQRFTDLVNGVHPAGGPGGGFGHGPGGGGEDLAVAATYLGSTPANLVTQLQGGKTLAQAAAGTAGKSTSGLIAALVAAEKTEIASYVTLGKLTQAQADQMTATLTQRFTDFVNGVRPAGGPGHDGFRHGSFRQHGLFQPQPDGANA